MSTVQHAGDVLNSGINQDNSLPISPEQEADPANIVDTDMDAEEEDYSSGEDEEYHEDDDIFGKGNVYDSNHLNMSNRITGPSDRNESADGQISNLGFNLDGANQLGSIPQTNSAENVGNVWDKHKEGKLSYAGKIKMNNQNEKTKLEFIPPMDTPEGGKRVIISNEDLRYSATKFSLYLYGYFLGTSMDLNVVNATLKRLWRSYDIDTISKSTVRFYYFKFKSEKGMEDVLANGPWLINNIPILIKKWVPGVCLQRIEPSAIPLWVTVHNVPLELWTGKGLSKLLSGVGRPLLMDRITEERCNSQMGKIGYARVLVEVEATTNLPNHLEVEFPSINQRPARIVKLDVSYQWKPPMCLHCKVFGHSFQSCKIRPLSEEEKLTRNEKAQGAHITYTNPIPDAEGFTTMRNRRNGNTGKSTSRLQQGESSDKNKRTSVQEKLKNVGNKEHQSISSDSNIQRKMGELHQSFRTHQVARVGMKSMNQVYRKKMGSHPFNTRKPAGTNLKAGKKHSDIYLSNCFDLLDEDDSVLDLEASILKGDLVSTGKVSRETNQVYEQADMEDVNTDNESVDFGITDAQKLAIINRLVKFKSVRAEDQENWEQGMVFFSPSSQGFEVRT
ncbi:hypothetical protein R6Q59_002755 [Mikania micrantha]